MYQVSSFIGNGAVHLPILTTPLYQNIPMQEETSLSHVHEDTSTKPTTQNSSLPSSKTSRHVYRDELLTRLLVDLFMSRKEYPHEENHTAIDE